MLKFFYLLLAIVFEVVATISLKLSNGYTQITPTIVMAISYVVCFYFLLEDLKPFLCLNKKAIEQKKQSPRLKLNKLNKTFRRPRGRRSAAQPGTTPPIRSSDSDSIEDFLRNPLKHNSSELLTYWIGN